MNELKKWGEAVLVVTVAMLAAASAVGFILFILVYFDPDVVFPVLVGLCFVSFVVLVKTTLDL